jgi:hypothetical protein
LVSLGLDVDMLIILVTKTILEQIVVKFIKVLPFGDTKYYPPLVIPYMLELLFIHNSEEKIMDYNSSIQIYRMFSRYINIM